MRYFPCDAMRIVDGAAVAERPVIDSRASVQYHCLALRSGSPTSLSIQPPHTYLLHRGPRRCPLYPILPRFKHDCKRQGQRHSSTAATANDSDVEEWSPQSNGRKESGARQSRVRDRSANDREPDDVPASRVAVNWDLNPDDSHMRRPSERRQSESRQEMPSK
jgi:hypothetical protein